MRRPTRSPASCRKRQRISSPRAVRLPAISETGALAAQPQALSLAVLVRPLTAFRSARRSRQRLPISLVLPPTPGRSLARPFSSPSPRPASGWVYDQQTSCGPDCPVPSRGWLQPDVDFSKRTAVLEASATDSDSVAGGPTRQLGRGPGRSKEQPLIHRPNGPLLTLSQR